MAPRAREQRGWTKYTESSYIAGDAKKTGLEINAGTKKVEDIRADILDQVKQWGSCAQTLVFDYLLSDQAIELWKNGLNRCDNVELGYMREVADSHTRFTCKINPQEDLEKVIASANVLTGTLRGSEKELGLSRLCTSGQMIYTEADKVVQIARTGVAALASDDHTNSGGEKCSELKTKLREERKKMIEKKREAEKAWRDKNKKETDKIWGKISTKESENAEAKYEELKNTFEDMKNNLNNKVEDYKNEKGYGYNVNPVFDYV